MLRKFEVVPSPAVLTMTTVGFGINLASLQRSEKRHQLPNGGKTDQPVNDTAQSGVVASEQASDQISFMPAKGDSSPIDATHDNEQQRDNI
jgi:hypothetical protein